MTRRLFIALPAAAPLAAESGGERIDLDLQRQSDGAWSRVDPRTVLNSGDRIRFRFTSTTPGWLCVYYTGSGGQAEWLLPSRLVVKDTAYLIPNDPASFSVSGPPGLDVLYWILSPKQLPLESLVPASVKKPMPNTMVPRCRAGKEPETVQTMACLDDRAGPALLDPDSSPLKKSQLRSRDLTINSGSQGASIRADERNIGVIVYEFRIAHR